MIRANNFSTITFIKAFIIIAISIAPVRFSSGHAEDSESSSEQEPVSVHMEFLDAPQLNEPVELLMKVSSAGAVRGSAVIRIPDELDLLEGEVTVEGGAAPGEDWQHVILVRVNSTGEFKINARFEGTTGEGLRVVTEKDLYMSVAETMVMVGEMPVRIPREPVISYPEENDTEPVELDWDESQPPDSFDIADGETTTPFVVEPQPGTEESYPKPEMGDADGESIELSEGELNLLEESLDNSNLVIAEEPAEDRELIQDESVPPGERNSLMTEDPQGETPSFYREFGEGEETSLAGVDLIVFDIWSSTNPLNTSDWEDITIQIRNQGTDSIGQGFHSRLKIDGIQMATWFTSGLGASATATASVNVLVKTGGLHQVQAEVDYAGAVAETNESNNVRTENWIWTSAADLIVQDIWSTTNPLHTSNIENITFRIKNQGTSNIAHGFYSRLRIDGGVISAWYTANLNANETADSLTEVIVSTGGSHQVEVAVDYTGLVGEANEGNNVRSETWTWTNAADLIVQDLWSTTTPLTTSAWENITFRIKNQGSGNIASTFSAILRIDGGFIDTWVINGLGPNATSTLSVDTIVSSPGTHQVQGTIDYTGVVGETNEGNNVRTENWSWPNAADLIVQDLWSDTNPLNAGEVENISFRIKNQGTGGVGAQFSTRFWVDGSVISTLHFGAGLASGATFEGDITTSVVSSGSHTVKAQVDYSNTVSETNEGNNIRTENWSWTNAPDLIVADIWSTTNPLEEVEVENITFRIRNDGEANVSASFSTRLSIDGTVYDTWVMGPLASKATTTGSFSVQLNAPYNHEVKVEVDYLGNVAEGDEANNIRTETWFWAPLPRIFLPLTQR
jgi:subtilase family serine protease